LWWSLEAAGRRPFRVDRCRRRRFSLKMRKRTCPHPPRASKSAR
jgi:hypothetical protein